MLPRLHSHHSPHRHHRITIGGHRKQSKLICNHMKGAVSGFNKAANNKRSGSSTLDLEDQTQTRPLGVQETPITPEDTPQLKSSTQCRDTRTPPACTCQAVKPQVAPQHIHHEHVAIQLAELYPSQPFHSLPIGAKATSCPKMGKKLQSSRDLYKPGTNTTTYQCRTLNTCSLF